MSTPPTRPVLRHLDVHPVQDDDNPGLVLVDPLGLVDDQVFVPQGLLPVVSRFDGRRTLEEIRGELTAETGGQVPLELIERVARDLDERLLLQSSRFQQALNQASQDFAAAPERPARHAGSAGYPAEPEALRAALSSMVRRSDEPLRDAPLGLVAPHIDLARGREGYSLAYSFLAECEPADLYVVFGTGHQGPRAVVTGLSSDWQTPLGAVPTDRDFVAAIHQRLGGPDPHDVWLHRAEHSLEFQVLFLQHVLSDRPFRVAGFLTGHLPPGPGTGDAPAADVLAAFEATAAESGQRVCYVAGADLAHLGPFFGDPSPIDEPRLAQLDAAERARLGHVERGEPAAFHRDVEGPGNPDRVCGTTPIYLTAALAGGPGELLHYGQATAADGSQVVSFCSMAFGAA
ncbi:MAG: AmmeMemoRadiSam system protein B [Planctomycetota bacterium]